MRAIGLAAMVMLAGAAPLRADPPEPKCLVPSHVWDKAEPITAVRAVSGVPVVRPGGPAMVKLIDAAKVRFAVPLARPVADGDKGGLVILKIREAGTYRIALQHKAWIDMMRGGRAIESSAHAHGAPCSGIAKMVDFRLPRGVYTLQLSAAADETTGLSVTKQP
ncbi:hypothetical protein [Sphingomonas oryzagri]